jgi:hypothetical protein
MKKEKIDAVVKIYEMECLNLGLKNLKVEWKKKVI